MNFQFHAIVAPINRVDVDTDAIIPKQYLRSVENQGYGDYLFDGWRYLDRGELGEKGSERQLNPDFVLNQPRFSEAGILLCRRNFGSGSAREHAVWALRDFGIRALIAPSYGEIFYNNCFKNGLLPITLPETAVGQLFQHVADVSGFSLNVDLERQLVTAPSGQIHAFSINSFCKRRLLEGIDDISFALEHQVQIRAFEERRRELVPWVFYSLAE